MLRRIFSSTLAIALAIAGALTFIEPASAGLGGSLTVNTTDDGFDEDDDGICEATDGQDDCTLRAALRHTELEDAWDITVPAGTYVLDEQVHLEDIDATVHGAGAATTIVSMGPEAFDRHLDLDTDGEIAMTLSDMTFTGGDRRGDGGSIFTESGAHLELLRMHFLDNTATSDGGAISVAGIDNDQTLIVEDTTFSDNEAGQVGGAVVVTEGETASFTNSTFTGNHAALGGALFVGVFDGTDDAEATLTHVTIAGNTAEGFQGAEAGAIAVGDGAEVTLEGTAIENSTEGTGELQPAAVGDPITNCEVFGGSIVSAGHNVVDDDSCELTEDTDQPETAANVQALANNGGPTPTMALLADSPAVDAAGATCDVTDDQRGVARPQDGNDDGTNGCDAGAYELAAVEEPPAAQPAEETPNFTG